MKTIRGIAKNSSKAWKVCQFLLLMVAFTFIAMALWAVVLPNSQDISSMKVLQMLQTIATFLFPSFCCAYLWSNNPFKWLKLDVTPTWKMTLLAIILIIVLLPGINLLSYLNQQIALPTFLSQLESLMQQQEEAATELTEQFIKADSVGVLFYNLFLMAFLPAISEEVCFRGILLRLFTPDKYLSNSKFSQNTSKANSSTPHIAIWVCAILFSAIHFQFYGFIPRMLLGALFGYLVVWSGSLWLPVIAHFTNNAIAVLSYNWFYMQTKDPDIINDLGTGHTLWLGISSLVIGGVLFYLFCHISNNK